LQKLSKKGRAAQSVTLGGASRFVERIWLRRFLAQTSVVSRKYLYTGKLSFSACRAENPGALKITGFFARSARRMTCHRPLGVPVICKKSQDAVIDEGIN
jgi:hypothetical protein